MKKVTLICLSKPLLDNWRQVVGGKRANTKTKQTKKTHLVFLFQGIPKPFILGTVQITNPPYTKFFWHPGPDLLLLSQLRLTALFMTYTPLAPHIAKHLTSVYKSKLFVIFFYLLECIRELRTPRDPNCPHQLYLEPPLHITPLAQELHLSSRPRCWSLSELCLV